MNIHSRRRRSTIALGSAAFAGPHAADARLPASGKPHVTGEARGAQPKALRSADSCGCAMGAKFMIFGLLASAAWYGWQFHAGEVSLRGAVVHVIAVTFAAAGAGKVFGILWHRWDRRTPQTRMVLRQPSLLPTPQATSISKSPQEGVRTKAAGR
jgi:hypothetical protein